MLVCRQLWRVLMLLPSHLPNRCLALWAATLLLALPRGVCLSHLGALW